MTISRQAQDTEDVKYIAAYEASSGVFRARMNLFARSYKDIFVNYSANIEFLRSDSGEVNVKLEIYAAPSINTIFERLKFNEPGIEGLLAEEIGDAAWMKSRHVMNCILSLQNQAGGKIQND